MPMIWQRFTERTKRVVIQAHEAAIQAGHRLVAPEHLLLAIVKDDGGDAVEVLRRLGVPLRQIQEEMEQELRFNSEGRVTWDDVLLHPRTKQVVDFAVEEEDALGMRFIGTEDLLIGILREGDGSAFRALSRLGVSPESVRQELHAYLGGGAPDQTRPPGDALSAAVNPVPKRHQ